MAPEWVIEFFAVSGAVFWLVYPPILIARHFLKKGKPKQ